MYLSSITKIIIILINILRIPQVILSVLVSVLIPKLVLTLVLVSVVVLSLLLMLVVLLVFGVFSAGNTLKCYWCLCFCFKRMREPSPEKGSTNEQHRTHYRWGLHSHQSWFKNK